MSLLSFVGGFIGGMGWYILPFLVILSVVVFFHELGHYLVGRWCGVTIDAFSLGFGPELLAWVDRRGTRWRLAAFPLGGYVKFHGDSGVASAPDTAALAGMAQSERARTLAGQPVRQSRRDRRGRADRQFSAGDRDFHDLLRGLRPVSVAAARRRRRDRQSGRSRGLPNRGFDQVRQRERDRKLRGSASGDLDQHRPADRL